MGSHVCTCTATLCQEFIPVLLLKHLPPFLFSVFFNKLAVSISITLPYAYMCNGHHVYELIALLMLFVCLQISLVVLSLQQNSYLKICPFSCALVAGDFQNQKMHLRRSRHKMSQDAGPRSAREGLVPTYSTATPHLMGGRSAEADSLTLPKHVASQSCSRRELVVPV